MLLDTARIVALVALPVVTPGLVAVPTSAQTAPSSDERVAALKQSLQDNQARLRRYEWVETTIISLKGEEKARKQQRCYYGADGKVQKVPIEAAPAAAAAPAGRRRGGPVKQAIVENKKDDMREYMERAAALIHRYVPPEPALIQKVKDAGHLAMKPLVPGRARLEFTEYLQPGDLLAIELNTAANTLAAVTVGTYLDQPEDVVALDVLFASLPDGTSHPSQTTLDAKAKNIRVVIQNSGHRLAAQ
jgi:hypothetical protein